MAQSKELGTAPIGRLLVKMAVPASVGILVMSINFIVDTIFVGRYVGTLGIAAITVVLPISFLISSIGMAIGVGGASVISRALGAGEEEKASHTFGNMITLTLGLAVLFVLIGAVGQVPVLQLFGAQGDILGPAREYFNILLFGIPALAWAMMANNVMRSEGKPKMAMISMLIPAIANMILDPIFIIALGWGLQGAAWATSISYFMSAVFSCWFFWWGPSELELARRNLRPNRILVKEITAIGFVTLARQGTVSLLTIVLNHSLFAYGNELAVAVFGVINRIMMFANFPVLGITQGFLPIAGYNYGAQEWRRVKRTIRISILSGTGISVLILGGLFVFARPLVGLFTTDEQLLSDTPGALRLVFLAMPLITSQLVGSAYFQAIGKARPALLLTMTKQGFFLIPLVLGLPLYFGLQGIWYAFPLADVLATLVTVGYLLYEIRRSLDPEIQRQMAGKAQAAQEGLQDAGSRQRALVVED